MIIELQIKGQTTRLSMEQAYAIYKDIAPLFKEEYSPEALAPCQHPYPWWLAPIGSDSTFTES